MIYKCPPHLRIEYRQKKLREIFEEFSPRADSKSVAEELAECEAELKRLQQEDTDDEKRS